jgi:hypothetical protein
VLWTAVPDETVVQVAKNASPGRDAGEVSLFESSVRRFTIDNDTRAFEVELVDGTVHRQNDAFPAEDASLRIPADFRRVTFDTRTHTLELVAPSGDSIVLEVYANDDQALRRDGRPVIYLDQNHWIQLGRSMHAPQRVPSPELGPARELIRLAEQRRVILPVSSGHMIETTQTDSTWRERLAPLMVKLSRGWLMRDPLRVRRAELRWMFSRHAAGEVPVGAVITLNPGELSSEDLEPLAPADDLPPAMQYLANTMSAVTAIFGALLDDELLNSQLAAERSSQWATAHYEFAQHLKSSGLAREHYRQATLAMFLSDLTLDIAHAAATRGTTLAGLQTWVTELADDELALLPYVGRSREVIHLRLCNARDAWKANDLIDMLFLPCAAAYCDFVVGEKKTIDYLVRAERSRSDGAVLVSSLAALVDRLDPALRAAS